MFVPFITKRSKRNLSSSNESRDLHRRKGGGGGGRGGGGGGGGKGGSSGGKGGSGPGSARSSGSINAGGTTKTATAFGAGGGTAVAIPAGMPFAGRQAGGGTRGEVYGNKQYGSGYPNDPSRGVAGRGFPFYFWPVPWIGAGVGGSAYLYRNDFSNSNNSSRPGGLMMSAPFTSASLNNTFWVLADNETTRSLVEDIRDACLDLLDKTDTVLTPYGENFTTPKPEQVVQYYRASSVALALEGYNNTAVFEDENTPDVPLPSGIDTTLLDCLNNTIGEAVPLVDAAFSVRWSAAPSSMGLVGIAYVVWSLSSLI